MNLIRDRAIIARLRFSEEGIILPPEYYCWESALMAEVEWYWSEDREKAFVFATHLEADTRARELKEETGRHCSALVLGSDKLAEERETRQRNRMAGVEASVAHCRVSPEEAYAALERRHLD